MNSMKKKHFFLLKCTLKQRFIIYMNRCTNIFSHPDYTVGSGVTPDQQRGDIEVMSSFSG
ncbi:hypothetical protein [Fictibacillus barbaricus]|uniref:hypothetical protein n=1 Tax=Fictibacillus barbaricus TaxID=182136 RepID=UPI0019CDBED4|nr:hypothetical protein GCM10007199_09780 [Fictibacillus barbaricus]